MSPFVVPAPQTTFTEGVQNSLAPWGAPGSQWMQYVAALGSMFEQVFGIVSDQGSPDEADYTAGWSTLLDPTVCPTAFLPYLAQFVGVQLPPNTDDATARSLIEAEAGFQRGTAQAILAAATRNTTGTQAVTLLERTTPGMSITVAEGQFGSISAVESAYTQISKFEQSYISPDPYHFMLVVNTSEIPDQPALVAAVDAVRPAGVQWTLVGSIDYPHAPWLINNLEQAYNTIAAVEAAFGDVFDVEVNLLPHA